MEDTNKIKNKFNLAILITAGMLMFILGASLGISFHIPNKAQAVKIQVTSNLSSKVVSSIVAYGQVKNINGRNITLSNLGDNLAISIADHAQVYSFAVHSGAAVPVQQTIKFEDIKIGDNVNVAIKLLPAGQLEGSSVIILPLPTQNK